MDQSRLPRDYIQRMNFLSLMADKFGSKYQTISSSPLDSLNRLEVARNQFPFEGESIIGRPEAPRDSPHLTSNKDNEANRDSLMGFHPLQPHKSPISRIKDYLESRQDSDDSDSDDQMEPDCSNSDVIRRSFGMSVPPPNPFFAPMLNRPSMAPSFPAPISFTTHPHMATALIQDSISGGACSLPQQTPTMRPFDGAMDTGSKGNKRPRGEKKPIPDEHKDLKYFERRKRNNMAAKKSRDNKKNKDEDIARRAVELENEITFKKTMVIQLNVLLSNTVMSINSIGRMPVDPDDLSRSFPRP